jgi:hypothetical protein
LGYRLKIMPITINGSGTVTGISAGGLPDGCIVTADIADNNVTTAKIDNISVTEIKIADNNVTTTKIADGAVTDAKLSGTTCKAWVNFDGTGTPAIRASYNVSSITDNGTGDYTVNFTTAFADVNYAAAISCRIGSTPTSGNGFFIGLSDTAPTTSAFRVSLKQANSPGVAGDVGYVFVTIFR